MKHIRFKPDIEECSFGALDEINAVLRRAAAEIIHSAFEDDESTHIYFPAEFGNDDGIGGEKVDDPLTVYLRVGVTSADEDPTYAFNLRDALKSTMDICANDGSYSQGLSRISAAMRSFADDIDAVIAKSSDKL